MTRQCYFPSRGCEHNKGETCDAPIFMFNHCKGMVEDEIHLRQWEAIHEPPEE